MSGREDIGGGHKPARLGQFKRAESREHVPMQADRINTAEGAGIPAPLGEDTHRGHGRAAGKRNHTAGDFWK